MTARRWAFSAGFVARCPASRCRPDEEITPRLNCFQITELGQEQSLVIGVF